MPPMLKIVITGPTGLIGSRMIELLKNSFEFIPLTHKDLDITNRNKVQQKLSKIDFDLLLHLAAYTNVDKAETEKELAYKINVEGTKNLLETTLEKRKKIIYISTDFVFKGDKPSYYEDSQPDPISYYGLTKYEGEKIVGNKGMIVRLSYPYRASFELKHDFFQNIKSFLEQKNVLKMVTNSLMTPTFVDDICFALEYLIKNYSIEIFHLVGTYSFSPYHVAKLIAKKYDLDQTLIQPITYEEYFKFKAKRPQFAEIKSKKNNFYTMKSFEEGLTAIKKQSLISN